MNTPHQAPPSAHPLRVDALTIDLLSRGAWAAVVDRASFELHRGEVLGIVGESGCGKTLTARAIMGLLPERVFRIASGSVLLFGEEIVGAQEKRMRQVRGARIAMVFQEPLTALNPVLTIGDQIIEAIQLHRPVSRRERRAAAIHMLRRVHIASPELRVDHYPHQMSGGMRQRVMIAMALSMEPDILIADEPTTALDVTVQAQILDLLAEIRSERGISILLISHDLGVVARACDRILVMYAGQLIEVGATGDVLRHPLHPYSAGLLGSIPRTEEAARKTKLDAIPGVVPDLLTRSRGCRFQTRCFKREERCLDEEPLLARVEGTREARCHFPMGPGEGDRRKGSGGT